MLLEPSHGLPLMLLPVTNVVPLLLDWFPHPKALSGGEFSIGGHIRSNQQQRATSRATSLFPKSEIPLAVRALVTPRSESHKSLPRACSISPQPFPDKRCNPGAAARAESKEVMGKTGVGENPQVLRRLAKCMAQQCFRNTVRNHRVFRSWPLLGRLCDDPSW